MKLGKFLILSIGIAAFFLAVGVVVREVGFEGFSSRKPDGKEASPSARFVYLQRGSIFKYDPNIGSTVLAGRGDVNYLRAASRGGPVYFLREENLWRVKVWGGEAEKVADEIEPIVDFYPVSPSQTVYRTVIKGNRTKFYLIDLTKDQERGREIEFLGEFVTEGSAWEFVQTLANQESLVLLLLQKERSGPIHYWQLELSRGAAAAFTGWGPFRLSAESRPSYLKFSPRQRWLAIIDGEGNQQVLKILSSEQKIVYEDTKGSEPRAYRGLYWSEDERFLAAPRVLLSGGRLRQEILIWDLQSQKSQRLSLETLAKGKTTVVSNINFLKDGELIYQRGSDEAGGVGQPQIWWSNLGVGNSQLLIDGAGSPWLIE